MFNERIDTIILTMIIFLLFLAVFAFGYSMAEKKVCEERGGAYSLDFQKCINGVSVVR